MTGGLDFRPASENLCQKSRVIPQLAVVRCVKVTDLVKNESVDFDNIYFVQKIGRILKISQSEDFISVFNEDLQAA